ncbi:MAG: ketoacyl-ACP synthase III [Capnocytophaga sp.]|nr:ketoacyl-ACP synthase III [Capnocytophaga sp.]
MSYIKAISTYVPKKIVTNDEISERFPEWNSEKIFNKIGIAQRFVSADDEFASDLAARAIENLLSEHSIDKTSIDFLLVCTQSPDYQLPSTACLVQEKVGLPISCAALDINQGCSGYIYGLSVADGLIACGNFKNVLLVTVDTYTKYLHPKDKGNITIFGDGATATLISTEGEYRIGKFTLGTDGTGAENLIIRNGGSKKPKTSDTEDLDNYLEMKGGKIFSFIVQYIPPVVLENLKLNNESISSMDLFVFHQANTHILEKVRQELDIPKEKFVLEMLNYGNTVSSSIPLAFKNHLEQNPEKANNKVLFVGFGVGYSWGSVCVEKVI